MTHGILALVLLSALAHATWNLLAKRSEGGIVFQWMFTALSVPIYAPVALIVGLRSDTHVGLAAMGLIAGSAALHLVYFMLLSRGYRAGDLSLIYPMARGTGPLLSTIGAILLLGERPGAFAILGTVLIVTGVFFLTGDPRALRAGGSRRAVAYAALTGLFIAAYTLWDKEAVSRGQLAPIFFYWSASAGMAAALSPTVVGRARDMRDIWRKHRLEVLGVAVLSPLAYFLVLTALVTAPVSYVAPIRESGILIGAVMGLQLLAEGHARRRLAAAAMMMAGVIALALG